MRKTTLAAMALVCAGALTPSMATLSAQEVSPTATKDVYDFSKFKAEDLLNLFYKVLQDGRQYPTDAEFESLGILPSDIAFVRSHVRRASLLPRTDRLVQNTNEQRELWCNFPMDIGSDGLAGYPDGDFGSDVFSMWNYTNIFGSWNHSFFQAPGAWVDAAHKNGTIIMSGIKFFESWGTGDGSWTKYCTAKNEDGSYKYVKPLINILMYFGQDGINFNWEDSSYANKDVVAFHKALWKEAAAQGLTDFQLGLYTSASSLTPATSNALFGSSDGRTATTMLNYMGGDFSYALGQSARSAISAMGTTEGLYAGVWIVTMDRGWNRLNADADAKKVNLCLWGEHGQSRFMSYNTGLDAMDTQENYQRLLERGFSGGNRNPAQRPTVSNIGNNWETDASGKVPLSTFCGLAEFIPERSGIQGNLPFYTYFNLGNGDRYNYKGKKTGSSWYNMANQDRVPTYRWLVYNAGTETVSTDIQPEFSHADAYTGGSCLKLTGKATSTGTDIVLFKTKLTVANGSPVARIALKSGVTGVNASNLSVIVRKEGSTTWQEFPVGDLAGATWEEKTIDLSALAKGDVIDRIGLRVKGSADNYSLYVGKLQIDDELKGVKPAPVKDLVAEVKEETKESMSLKLNWQVEATGESKHGLVYNDEANIDHFEILYKNGANGRVSEVGRTTQWATFVNSIMFESTDDQPYIGVRSVSTDLKTYSDIVWLPISRADQNTLPAYDNNSYGTSQIDPAAEGTDIARVQRYVTDVTTEGAETNLSYHADGPQADGTQYVNATDHVLKVRQGQEIKLFVKAYDTSNLAKTDGLRYCFAGGWLDLDGSGTFNPDPIDENPSEGERLFFLGKLRAATPEFETKGITHTFTVPADARTGKSRLRIVFSDAWFAGMFQPTGYTAKGFSIDFGVEIVGDNPQRPTPPDAHDQGTADEPDGLTPETGITETTTGQVSHATVSDGLINFTNVDKAWIYGADGRLLNYVTTPSLGANTQGYAPGTYVVKMQYQNVIRSQKVVLK